MILAQHLNLLMTSIVRNIVLVQISGNIAY